ncbi:hypothetical protein [Luteimonas aquatica]|uniref:hypothetical protein n=1 Tax=Luteimonas aquatica TaxID=450364 RepID=UPI001F562F19|nr:hypothetical protein [Luteimonas aquatica]
MPSVKPDATVAINGPPGVSVVRYALRFGAAYLTLWVSIFLLLADGKNHADIAWWLLFGPSVLSALYPSYCFVREQGRMPSQSPAFARVPSASPATPRFFGTESHRLALGSTVACLPTWLLGLGLFILAMLQWPDHQDIGLRDIGKMIRSEPDFVPIVTTAFLFGGILHYVVLRAVYKLLCALLVALGCGKPRDTDEPPSSRTAA